jgi:hypothetical protein
MTSTITLTAAQAQAAVLIDALDLEPITYKLMHPHPGAEAMTLAEADQLTAAYRCHLKLCAWYRDESVVPSSAADEAWHAHILDTAKYAEDCDAVFGFFLHHFPYFGLRGPADELTWREASARARELHAAHFGTETTAPADCDNGQLCVPASVECDKRTAGRAEARPRPDRAAA